MVIFLSTRLSVVSYEQVAKDNTDKISTLLAPHVLTSGVFHPSKKRRNDRRHRIQDDQPTVAIDAVSALLTDTDKAMEVGRKNGKENSVRRLRSRKKYSRLC